MKPRRMPSSGCSSGDRVAHSDPRHPSVCSSVDQNYTPVRFHQYGRAAHDSRIHATRAAMGTKDSNALQADFGRLSTSHYCGGW